MSSTSSCRISRRPGSGNGSEMPLQYDAREEDQRVVHHRAIAFAHGFQAFDQPHDQLGMAKNIAAQGGLHRGLHLS